MMEGLLAPDLIAKLTPQSVSPSLLALVEEDAPTRAMLCAGAGSFEQAYVTQTCGIHVGQGEDAAEQIAACWSDVGAREGSTVPASSWAQGQASWKKPSEPSGASLAQLKNWFRMTIASKRIEPATWCNARRLWFFAQSFFPTPPPPSLSIPQQCS